MRLHEKVLEWLDERYGARSLIEKYLTGKIVPPHVNWTFCFGGLAFFSFGVQVLTGIFLMIYYDPTQAGAFESVQRIYNDVPFGWLMHRVHSINANLMILLVIMHLLRVLFYGAYKKPRELHWVSGFLLLCLTLLMGFSVYLLPWTQLSYWASTVGTKIPGDIPVIGEYIVELMRGGEAVTGYTLKRFYAMHTVALPALIGAFSLWHFVLIRSTGISEPL